jgi:hypothetical protein
MIAKLKVSLGLEPSKIMANDRRMNVYKPERPINFVRRSDPSFYFLSKR